MNYQWMLRSFIFIFLSFFYTGHSCAQWAKEKEIRRLIDENRKCEATIKDYFERSKQHIGEIEKLENIVLELKSEIAQMTATTNLNIVSETGKPTNPNTTRTINENEELQSKLNELKKQLAANEGLRRTNGILLSMNASLKQENYELEQTISSLRSQILELEGIIKRQEGLIYRLESELERLRSIISCIDTFNRQRSLNQIRAREDLEAANQKYANLRSRRNVRGDSLLYKGIREVWEVYARYPVNCQEIKCGPYVLNVCDDYKEGVEHLNAAEMLAANTGNIVDQFGKDLNEKLNTMNELLLSELGQAIAKGDYNTRSEARRIVEDLPYLIVAERKGREIRPSVNEYSPGNAEILANIRRIPEAYKKKNYAESIALYSRYHRFFELIEFQRNIDLVAESKFCVGTILLWNLADINSFSSMSIPNSWLSNSMQTLAIQRKIGHDLLVELTRQQGLGENLYKKVNIVLGKTN